MKQNPAADAVDPSDEIVALVRTLHDTQRRLQELTGGQVDAVMHPDGQSYLLRDAQERLRQSGEALRLSESALALGQQIAHLGSWELDLHDLVNLEANPLRWSDEMFRIAGFEPGAIEISHGLFFNLIPEEDRARFRQELATAVRDKKEYAVVHRLIRPDGQRRFVHQMGQIFVGDDGRPIKIVGTAHDITDQKTSELQLSLLHTCVAKLNDIVLITEADPIDPPGPRIVFVNEAFERITGHKADEAIGRNPRFLQGPRTDRRVLAEIREALVQKKSIKRQIFNYAKDGTEYCLELEILPVFDTAGKCISFVAVQSDVTEENKIKEQLAWRTAMFEAQVNSSLDAILIVDSQNRKVLQNQRMTDLWEIPADIVADADDQRQIDWVTSKVKNTEQLVDRIAHLKANPDEISRDELELKNGQYLDWYSAPVRGSDGNHYGRILIFRDITERKKVERQTAEQMQLMTMAGSLGKLGAWSLEMPGKQLVWSEEVFRLHEVEPGYITNFRSALGFYPPATSAKIESAIDSGQAYDIESEFLTAKGSKRWVRTTGVPEMQDGQLRRFYGLFQDITEQKQNESRFRRLVDSNAQGVFIWDTNGRISEANDALLNLTGYTREDLKAGRMNWSQMTPAEFIPIDQRAMQEIADKGVCQSYEKEWIRKDGTRIPILIGAAIFEDNRNEGICFVLDLTERKRSESRFRRVVDSNAQAMMFWKSTGEIVDANDAFLHLVGYTREDLESGLVNWRHLTPPEFEEADRRALEEIAARGFSEPLEKEWIRKDGSRVPVYLSAACFEDSPDQGVTFALDLTERKRAEEAQRISEERFSHAFEYAPNGIILLSPEGHVITANRVLCDLVGYPLDELTNLNFHDITHPDDVPKEAELIRGVLAGEMDYYQIDKRYLHKQGHEVWAQLNASLVRDSTHQPLYFIKQIQNISEIKRAYEQIAEQAALIDEASDAIFSRDLEHRVIFWGKGAERLLGWTSEEASGKQVRELLKIDPARFAEADQGLREHGQWNGELQKTTKSGTALTFNTRWTLVRDAGGQPRSILTIATDITERKKLEQQFLRAQRMESIGTLAGGIAHDLNNILAPIMMSIDVLRSMSDNPEATEILETIRVSAKRGSDIVRQVLSFARGVEGRRIEVQPKHIVEDVENIVKNTFPKSVQVTTTIPRDTWTILGDPTQIHQILLNLCVNARDAMPNGGKLTLTMENFVLDNQYSIMSHEAKPGPYVQISVTDTGTGIPPELLERIFEPFFTTKEVSKGTGLGLSTVMAIVKSHEGTINVYSEIGKGTTFKVYLPALESTPEKRKAPTQRVSLPRGNGEMILVVDDEASILSITCQTLQAFNYQVLQAADGAEAVALYAKHEREIDVVLTDMMMPVLDGSALIHALKRMNPAVKIIAASGLNTDGNTAKVTEAGVNHFLTKPYTAGTLLKTLQEILHGT